MKNIQIVETVTFRSFAGGNPQAVAQASNAMTPFLVRQTGFISRRLPVGDDGIWLDHVQWANMDAAQAAAKAISSAPKAETLLALIDIQSATMRHDTLINAQAT
ncbi:hypothetical protein [Pacificibacter marinus]|uniref:ABM domain-containing protein n=1 Tax=Pacificibacter marinus TaxID=658057 RepID=A0A1Y5SSX1_9RHOB|nr:hypothetical protein [Pacificibacter marinus]SEK71171.1 hypothetical protein SAMN04488032_105190 [Pacificibacter marinus]SLN44403.1 hypothetical protein PAM7971_02136 [Pacificibacter marinus]